MAAVNENPRVLGNRYEVGDVLGRGGMAEVHLGRDTRLGRVVAIKLLRSDLARDATFQARFRREAQSAAGLNHPAIVAVYDTGEEQVVDSNGTVIPLPYIVMEYVEGRTLRELLNDGQPLDAGLALEITAGVLSALDYSHRAGIVHRDIKPANVMLTPAGDIKVMDFGIARALADSSVTMTQTQAVIGTAQYLSPEQARGETVDARSDLYSAGCLLYELITGRPPFVADSPVAVAYQHVREQPQPPSVFNALIPESVDRIVLHSLAKDRETRYQTALDFRGDIDAARTGRAVAATVPAGEAEAAATTQFLAPAAGTTRGMAPVAAGGMIPGLPPVDGDTAIRYAPVQDEPPRNRTWVWILAGLAVLLVFGVSAYLVGTIFNGPGGTKTRVPNVVAQTEAVATKTLKDAGFVVKVETTTSGREPGLVTDQDPDASTSHDQGTVVTIKISTGPAKVTIPDVAGQPQKAATDRLSDLGLNVVVETEESRDFRPGQTIRTDPKSGTSIQRGAQVKLVVASGDVTVPNVVGKSRADAEAELFKVGLLARVIEQEAADQPVGTVIGQNPRETAKLKQGSTVEITVAIAPVTPPPTESPTPSPTDSASPPPTDEDGDGQPDNPGESPAPTP
jgi:serine/threonine-protein kinase